jgi:hypothetical protein
MLPQRLVFGREIGDTEVPYWTPASLDGAHLHLEPGETVLQVCSCNVSQLTDPRHRPLGYPPEMPELSTWWSQRTAS